MKNFEIDDVTYITDYLPIKLGDTVIEDNGTKYEASIMDCDDLGNVVIDILDKFSEALS